MTTVRYVALVLDRYDGSGSPYVTGTAALAPSVEMPDPADQMLVGQAPVTAVFRSGPLPSRMLAATDSIGPQSNAWTWNVTYTGVPGNPSPASYSVPAGPAAFTATDANPAVFTWTPTTALTALPNGTGVQLSGSPPAGFSAATTYYVVAASGSTIELAATQGGSPLASTGTGSGNLTVVQYNLSALAAAAQTGQQNPSPWNLDIDQGSSAQLTFTLTDANGAPYPMTDTTWEYVARSGGDAVITITTTPSDDGSLTVTSTEELSQLALVINPAATSGLAAGTYPQALWMNPDTDTAYCWLAGSLTVSSVPQP